MHTEIFKDALRLREKVRTLEVHNPEAASLREFAQQNLDIVVRMLDEVRWHDRPRLPKEEVNDETNC